MRSLVILGGTFDPIHCGHLHLATAAAAAFSCPVRLIPNGQPPHRPQPAAAWRHRYAMCERAIDGHAALSVGDEEPPTQRNYTAATLAALKRRQPDTTLLLLIGADAYNTFDQWHAPDEVLRHAHLLVAPRPPATLPAVLPWGRTLHDKRALADGCGGVYFWEECMPPAVESTRCRAAIAAGESTDALLPRAVAAYIKEHGLYQGDA